MLAKAESGGTVSPPAEGQVRVGSRVPSAGTGMGIRSLLVSARKQGPPDPTLCSRAVKRTGSICRLGRPRPRLMFDTLRMAQYPQQTKLKTRCAGLVRDEFGYAHPLPSFRAVSWQVFNLPSLVLSVKCVSGRLGVVLPVPRAPLRWKTGLPRKVINLCFVLAGLGSWESAGLARPQTPLRAKLVLASEEDPAQGVFSPLWVWSACRHLSLGVMLHVLAHAQCGFFREPATEGWPA